ncbi:uncharacterized protein LOC126821827 [Patella vulgata]|uniref:uncharacterized protein LOC126821827 n=1 Tax=Patella vulgata TaxID=6465 RepID=UPI0021806CAA|nr:uncharacterized protein LOC126821827 [Patella vulgata]
MTARFTYHPVFDFRHNSEETDFNKEEDLEETDFNKEEDLEDLKMMEYDDHSFSFFNIHAEPSPNDASTQTELKKITLKTLLNDPALNTSLGSDNNTGHQAMEKSYVRSTRPYTMGHTNSTISRKKTNVCTGKKEHSPRTLMKLMERHRHNERLRHHTLNERLRAICRHVPGSGEDGRETKVVMMQRIISYIAYLENTVAQVTSGLGLEPDPKLAPLTTKLRKQIEDCANMAVVPDVDGFQHEPSISKKPPSSTCHNETCLPESLIDRRYKLSSPTIDSTTDRIVPDIQDLYPNSLESSQDSMAPSSTFLPYMANDSSLAPWLVDESMIPPNGDEFGFFDSIIQDSSPDFCTIPSESFINDGSTPIDISSQSNTSLQESLSLFPSPCIAFSNEDSPDYLGDNMNDTFGLQFHGLLENDHDLMNTIAVSPNKILPSNPDIIEILPNDTDTFAISPTKYLSEHKEHVAISPVKILSIQDDMIHIPNTMDEIEMDLDMNESVFINNSVWSPQKNKRKQYTPSKRQPLENMTNNSSPFSSDEISEPAVHATITISDSMPNKICVSKGEEKTEEQVVIRTVPYTWTFHSMNEPISKLVHSTKSDIEKNKTPKYKQNPTYREMYLKPQKVDHRKTSWMNGFMMYSRLNRRQFITANPGVHTSHISKMMGQTWRSMSSECQQPYKDKAKLYLKDMQKTQDFQFEEDMSFCEGKENDLSTTTDESFQVVPKSVTPIATPTRPSSTCTSTSTHPIYNSQRWTYL